MLEQVYKVMAHTDGDNTSTIYMSMVVPTFDYTFFYMRGNLDENSYQNKCGLRPVYKVKLEKDSLFFLPRISNILKVIVIN